MGSNFGRSSGLGVGLELVFVVGAVEVDGDQIGFDFDGGNCAFVNQQAISDLVEVGGQRGVNGVWIAGFKRAGLGETNVAVVNNYEAEGRNTRNNFLARTADLTTANAERRGDIYKG